MPPSWVPAILAAAAWCAVGGAACAQSAQEASRLLSFIQHWAGSGNNEVAQTNGCPGLVNGKLAEGTYRAQMVFWPGETAGQNWGAVAIGWKIGSEGREDAVVSLAGGGWTSGKPTDQNLTILSPYLPASASEGKSQALLRLLCGIGQPASGTHTRIDDALKAGTPLGSEALQALRDFIAPKDKGNSVPPLPALIEQAKQLAGSQYARTSGEAIDQRLQALHKSFLARLPPGTPGNGASALIPQSKIDESGKGVTAANPLDGEVKALRDKVKSLESNINGNAVMGGVATIVSFLSLAAVGVVLSMVFRLKQKLKDTQDSVSETSKFYLKKLKEYSDGTDEKFTKLCDLIDEISLRADCIDVRINDASIRSLPLHDGHNSSPHPKTHSVPPEINDRSQDDNQPETPPAIERPYSVFPPPLSVVEEAPSNEKEPSARPPDSAPFALPHEMLILLEKTLLLTDDSRARLLSAPSVDELARRLIGDLIPTGTPPETLGWLTAWLSLATQGAAQLIVPTVGARPTQDEVRATEQRLIERGMTGTILKIFRPGLRLHGAIVRQAEVEVGV